MRHAKIVCTLGPATAGDENVRQLVQAGMDVARLNFSHGDHEQHRQMNEKVRRASRELGKPVAILADLSGPKIRLGRIEGDEVSLQDGQSITITSDPILGTSEKVGCNYPQLARDVEPGTRIFADDGRLEFVVQRVVGEEVICEVITGGPLRSRKGLNIPNAQLSMPAVTEKDKDDIRFGLELGVDYFALSFVRTPADVQEARKWTAEVPIIAKIEKPSATELLEEIADEADGLMVARGDLGVEVGFEKVPLLQKKMVAMMYQRAKPVIIATQMLESMVTNPQPTRAEVSDVANALLDGSDAVMLSAETAAGRYPTRAVRTMDRIIREVESSALKTGLTKPPEKVGQPTFHNVIAHSAARAAIQLDLQAVVVHSETGQSAALVSAYRPPATIVGFSRHPHVVSRMALYWGVVPIFAEQVYSVEEIIQQTEETLTSNGLAQPGDEIAITFGLEDGGPPVNTMMKLWKIRPNKK